MLTGKRIWAVSMAIGLAVAACGGGDGDAGDLGEQVFGGVGDVSGDSESGGSEAASGGAEVGPVTQSADPGTGWIEVDGQRFDFEAFGSTHYSCELLPDRITINFQQTTAGNDFLFQASVLDGQWIGNLTFAPMGGDTQVSYGATLGFDPGTLGIGDQAVSYEGTLSRVKDFDAQNAQETDATIAVNCSSAGGDPTVEIAGETFTFPLSGAQSIDCQISDEEVQVLISRSNPDRLQLQIDVRDNGGELLGGVFVTVGDEQYDSIIPADGSGLSIDGASLSYEGDFGDAGEGSVSVTCG